MKVLSEKPALWFDSGLFNSSRLYKKFSKFFRLQTEHHYYIPLDLRRVFGPTSLGLLTQVSFSDLTKESDFWRILLRQTQKRCLAQFFAGFHEFASVRGGKPKLHRISIFGIR